MDNNNNNTANNETPAVDTGKKTLYERVTKSWFWRHRGTMGVLITVGAVIAVGLVCGKDNVVDTIEEAASKVVDA